VTADAGAAARAVVGVQAQDVRAAGLALRSRVPGLRRAGVDGSALVRTWTARGTVHLIDPADRPWLHAALGPRNRARFDAAMRQRGDYETAVGMLDDIVTVLRDGPLDRAGLLRELAARGHPGLGQRSVNVLMPWAAAQGLVTGLPDGFHLVMQGGGQLDIGVGHAGYHACSALRSGHRDSPLLCAQNALSNWSLNSRDAG